jgi:hypothetical protein
MKREEKVMNKEKILARIDGALQTSKHVIDMSEDTHFDSQYIENCPIEKHEWKTNQGGVGMTQSNRDKAVCILQNRLKDAKKQEKFHIDITQEEIELVLKTLQSERGGEPTQDDAAAALEELRKDSDRAYCRALDLAEKNCKGSQWKLENGKFGNDDLNWHCKHHELIGFHRGIYHAMCVLKPTLTDRAKLIEDIRGMKTHPRLTPDHEDDRLIMEAENEAIDKILKMMGA